MSDPKGKALPDLITMYLVMLVIYCLDVFFLQSDLTVLGDNFYSRFLCLTVLMLTVIFKREHIKSFGISKKKEKIKSALIFGTFFSVIPILIVSAAELMIFKMTDPANISVSFTPPSLSYVQTAGYLTPAVCIIIYVLTSILAAFFKETFFRGFLLHKLEKLTSFKSANAFQALLYTTFIIPKLIRNFTMDYYGEDIVSIAVFVVIFYLVHEFLTGIKWGMLAKTSGSVYIPIVDNFLYVFLANSLHVVAHQSKWLFMIHMLSAQLISFAMIAVYCKKASALKKSTDGKNDKKESSSAEKAAPQKSDSVKEKADEKSDEKATTDAINSELFGDKEAISPSTFKKLVRESSAKAETAHNGELSEKEIDSFLRSFGKPKSKYKPPVQKKKKPEEPTEFDVDDFLKGLSKK